MTKRAAIAMHLLAAFTNAAILLQTWPVKDPRIMFLVAVAFAFSFMVFVLFKGASTAHVGATAFHLAAIGALLVLPLPTLAAIILILLFPALVIR